MKAIRPLGEIRLRGETPRRIMRKARCTDHLCARAQQLERYDIADLHARPGYQRNTSSQIGRLVALGIVQIAARLAQRIIIEVAAMKIRVAHIAAAGAMQIRQAREARQMWLWAEMVD